MRRWWSHNTVTPAPSVIEDPKPSGAKTYTLPGDAAAVAGSMIALNKPKPTTQPPKDPEPDLSTKPKDIVGYCFGYVCPKKHVNSTFENITVDGYKERRACQTCGGLAKPAVVRRISEGKWRDWGLYNYFEKKHRPDWSWGQWYNGEYLWTRYEFVHYLDTPGRRKKK